MADQAEIHRDVVSVSVMVRIRAVDQLRRNFADLPDKEHAWKDLIRLTRDKDSTVRWSAVYALGSAFPHVLDKEQAWEDLYHLTQDNRGVRWHAVDVIGSAFPHILDKEQAWNYLIRLTWDKDRDVRWSAAGVLGSAFPHVPVKEEAWNDLIRLTQDEDIWVRQGATDALGSAFPHAPDKEHAWEDLHRMTQDEDSGVRWSAESVLGSAFLHVPDKEQAWEDLHRMTRDEDDDVRRGAAGVLGSIFPHVSCKEQAWNDLIRLTQDEDCDVRVDANHSLGRASIFKATDIEGEEDFRIELKNALKFFERSSKEATYFKPSKFCLPFYRAFYTITFEKARAEGVVQKYLAEAKSASEGSGNKETLLKAVENLANALSEAQKIKDFDAMKSDLNAYRQYCDRAADLIGSAEEGTPGAARVLWRGLPIIDDRIKKLLEEVKKKAEIVCETTDHPESELGCRIKQNAAASLATDNPVILSQLIDHGLREFEKRISSITSEPVKKYVQTSVIDAKNKDTVGKILILNSLIAALLPFPEDRGEEMSKYEIKNSVVTIAEGDGISQSIQSSTNYQKDLSQNNAEAHKPSEEPKKNTVPFLSDLESEICDIFKSVYQKERKEEASDVNSKTLEFLKYKLLDLTAFGKEIDWLDVGCGDGRCLDILDAVQNRGNIRYHGTDSSYRYLDDTEKRARKYKLNARLDKVDAAAMKFDSEYDVVSAVLLLHEVNPLCLPYILRNMLRALKSDGTLIIADFQGPYEQEGGVVTWGAEDIKNLFEKIGGAKMSIEFIPSSQYPDELGFYRCYVKKPGLDREKFSDLLQGYGNFLDAKKEESKQKRGELRNQIEERVRKLLNRPDIDLKNISEGEMQRIQTEIGDEYGIKAHKIRLLTSQIEFLDDKIKEFRNGVGCDGADQHSP
jgi:HEAT repeat protein/SAM-dependent methyltransferase